MYACVCVCVRVCVCSRVPVVLILLQRASIEEVGTRIVVHHGEIAQIRHGLDQLIDEDREVADAVLVDPQGLERR